MHQHTPQPTPPGADASRPRRCTSRQPRIAIVGGSLTGPVLALLLLRAGFENLTVYEAAPSLDRAGGGVMSLEHSALDILERADISLAEIVTSWSETIETVVVQHRVHVESISIPYPGRFTTWSLLHSAVSTRLPAGIVQSGVRITDLEERGGTPIVVGADGRTDPADIVLCADGRSSTGRALLDPARRRYYAGCVAHRGTSPRPGDPSGDFRRFDLGQGVQFNSAPIPGGQDWIFGLNATRAHYRALFGAAPEHRGYVTGRHISATARTYVDDAATRWLPDDDADLVRSTTERAVVAVMDIEPPSAMWWPIGNGFAALVGDALAPPRALTARGANTGIEQAADLVACLTQHRRYGADLGAALRGCERRCLPGVRATLDRGLDIGYRLGLGVPGPDDAITSHR